MVNSIIIKGAKEHNLKNISVEIPRDKFVVITGISGSGKSSLAFDTIYAEGQRRYIESLSAYARQFLGQMEKPDVELIEGLSPAISIDQKTTNKNPRSTVGTVTEVYDYLRLLFARVGTPHCPICKEEIKQMTVDEITDKILELDEGQKIQLLAPVIVGKKGSHKNIIEKLRKDGFVRARINGDVMDLDEEINLNKNKKNTIEVLVDRIKVKEGIEKRLSDSIEIITDLSGGMVLIDVIGKEEMMMSTKLSCPEHGIGIDELTPRMFSFNSPYGACSTCNGIGYKNKVDKRLIIPNDELSINKGAIAPWGKPNGKVDETYYFKMVNELAKKLDVDIDKPIKDLPKSFIDELLYGKNQIELSFEFDSKFGGRKEHITVYEGVVNNLERRYKETNSDFMRDKIETYMSQKVCPSCNGGRLKDIVLAVKFAGKNIEEITNMSIKDGLVFFETLKLDERKMFIGNQILKEIISRLKFLDDVGLSYLTLSRSASTLSGGESQRIRLATQIGSKLVGVLYVLDEPSIGLHQRDNDKLLNTLRELTDIGNTVLVVEHDEDTMKKADYIIDVGPGAGSNGGEIVAKGNYEEIINNDKSITGQYLSGKKQISIPEKRKKQNGKYIEIIGAKENNLKNINAKIPLGLLTCITGVSGSGKSTLITEILYKKVSQILNKSRAIPGKHKEIKGIENIDKIIEIDQSPIGRTPRSNPATYTGVFDEIREAFSKTQEARTRGYKKGRFSFNVKGGRCEACRGDGILKIEMHFLPDVYVPCDICKGHRYNRETLEVKYKGKNISDVLDMRVEEAVEFFSNIPKIKRKLDTLNEVGLSYIKLGQPSTQLSGGEAQRIKLATELSKRSTGKTLYILDEPTTGLHIADVDKLIKVLQELVKGDNSVVVIEHNLDVIKVADHIIDLGPEGGEGGGKIIAEGTPEKIIKSKKSFTGAYLKNIIKGDNSGR